MTESSSLLKAAIIGLGQVGSQFDSDPKRHEIWTHAGAYQQVPEVILWAGADNNPERLAQFGQERGVRRLYTDYRTMLCTEKLDIVSICTPTPLHAEMVQAAAEVGVRAIFCEKPLAFTVEEARHIVKIGETHKIVLAVNHKQRWDHVFLWARDLLLAGEIGQLQQVVGYYAGQVFNVGTHLFDTLRFYAGDVTSVIGHWAGEPNVTDPTVGGLLNFVNGVTGYIVPFVNRLDLIFEIELFGTEGRLRILDNGQRVEIYQFVESSNYTDYRELVRIDRLNPRRKTQRFVEAVKDIIVALQTGSLPICSGRDGLAAVEIALALQESARKGSHKISLPLRV